MENVVPAEGGFRILGDSPTKLSKLYVLLYRLGNCRSGKDAIPKKLGPGFTLVSDHTCANHANNIVEVTVTLVIGGKKFMGSLYRCCLLFRMGAYWVRLLLAVQPVLELGLAIKLQASKNKNKATKLNNKYSN